MKGGRAEMELSRVEMPVRVTVGDVMWMMRVIDNRIRGGSASKMLK